MPEEPTATLISKSTVTDVALAITGRAIDVGGVDDVPVTELRLTYSGTEIIHIGYDTVEDGVPSGATVHPDFYKQPEVWPGWVRELVDEHRPA